MRLEQKVAIVTGATQGIGLACAQRLIKEGARVMLVDIKPASRLWGYGRFVLGRGAARRQPGVRFAKVLGSGFDGGFGLKPSASRQGLLCLFDDDDTETRIRLPEVTALCWHVYLPGIKAGQRLRGPPFKP